MMFASFCGYCFFVCRNGDVNAEITGINRNRMRCAESEVSIMEYTLKNTTNASIGRIVRNIATEM